MEKKKGETKEKGEEEKTSTIRKNEDYRIGLVNQVKKVTEDGYKHDNREREPRLEVTTNRSLILERNKPES